MWFITAAASHWPMYELQTYDSDLVSIFIKSDLSKVLSNKVNLLGAKAILMNENTFWKGAEDVIAVWNCGKRNLQSEVGSLGTYQYDPFLFRVERLTCQQIDLYDSRMTFFCWGIQNNRPRLKHRSLRLVYLRFRINHLLLEAINSSPILHS